jgi:hypothetical protein
MDDDTGAEQLPATKVTQRDLDAAQQRVGAVLQEQERRLLQTRIAEIADQRQLAHRSRSEGPWPQPHATDDFFMQGADAARDEPNQRFVRDCQQGFQCMEDDSDDDAGPYGEHFESDEEDGYRFRRKAGAGDAVADDDQTGKAGVSATELPWTTSCNKEELQKLKCAFCKTAPAACIQTPLHLYNETYAKQQRRFPTRDAFHLNNDALDQVELCARMLASEEKSERRRCREARAVCTCRPCRISAGMIDTEAEAKWLSYSPVDKGKFNFNQRHDCPQILLRSLCKLRLVVVREAEEGGFDEEVLGRWMVASLDDLAQNSYWMCIQQKYFVTTGTLLTAESEKFGLRLDNDARADLAEKMARVPVRMFVSLFKKHLLDVHTWTGTELGYGPNNGTRKSWYWEITKNLLGRCWPKPLFVAYVELKVRQWIATDCPLDAQGRPRFVLKQLRNDPLLTDFWDGPEPQSKLLAPVFEHANVIMGRLNKPTARSGYWSSAFGAIQAACKTGGRNTELWQVMAIARALADPLADARANAPLVTKNKKRGKEFAVRDNSFIQKEDLDMVGCLNSAALGLRLAGAKEHALQRALPQWIHDAATAKEMTLGAYFKNELLKDLTLVRMGGNVGFAVGPKPEILDESGRRFAVINMTREKAALRMSCLAGVAAGIGKRTVKRIFGRARSKPVNEYTGLGMLTDDPTQWTPEMENIHIALTQSQYDAPGRAMDGVVRELVWIFDATGKLPTLATHPLHFDQLCAKEGPNTARVLMGCAHRISAAHDHFNLIRDTNGVSTSANLNIMAEVTTADVLFPGQPPGQSDAAWKARKVELINGWKSDVRVMLRGKHPSQPYKDQYDKRDVFLRQRNEEYQQYRHPILRFFFAPYTPALEKALGNLDVALAQFLQDVRLPAPLRQYQMRARPRNLAALPPDNPAHAIQRGATAQWEANYARDVRAGRVEDSPEAKKAYFTRDTEHPERCVEMALNDLRVRYAAHCAQLARCTPPKAQPSFEEWRKKWRIDADGLDYRLPGEEQRRRVYADKVFHKQWGELHLRFQHQLNGPQPKEAFDAEGNKIDPKQALCNYYLQEAQALFFELRPCLDEMVRDGPLVDGDAYGWFCGYLNERHQHSGGAGSRHYAERRAAAEGPTGMRGIQNSYATHTQIANANAILAHESDDAKLDALTAHLKRMAGLGPRLPRPTITPVDVQRRKDELDAANKGDNDNNDDGDADSDDDPGPGDAAAVGQKRPSRKKAKPTTLDQRHTKKKKEQAQRHRDAYELGLKDESAAHYDALEMSKKEQVHPATFLPDNFANCFRIYDSKIWGGAAAPSPTKKARTKKAPAKKAAGKKAPAKASMRQRRHAVVLDSSDEDEDANGYESYEEEQGEEESEEEAGEDESEDEGAAGSSTAHAKQPIVVD